MDRCGPACRRRARRAHLRHPGAGRQGFAHKSVFSCLDGRYRELEIVKTESQQLTQKGAMSRFLQKGTIKSLLEEHLVNINEMNNKYIVSYL